MRKRDTSSALEVVAFLSLFLGSKCITKHTTIYKSDPLITAFSTAIEEIKRDSIRVDDSNAWRSLIILLSIKYGIVTFILTTQHRTTLNQF